MDFPEMAGITVPDRYTAPNLRTAYCAGVLNWPEPEAVSSHRYTEQEEAAWNDGQQVRRQQ